MIGFTVVGGWHMSKTREVWCKLLCRPQFSMRTFLILVTLICPALGVVGAIKFKASSYRSAIAKLQASGIDVRRIRTEDGASYWESFVQDWIDNDAYAGDSVEVMIAGADLTEDDVTALKVFHAIRSAHLNSATLTDKTLFELRSLRSLSSLSVSNGAYTPQGYSAICQLNELRSLDLCGLTLGDKELLALKAAIHVDNLALKIRLVSIDSLREVLADRAYKRLFLEWADLECPFHLGGSGLPASEAISLKAFILDDAGLKQLSHRKELKSLDLVHCEFDGGIAVKEFRFVAKDQNSVGLRDGPLLRIVGHFEAKSEIGPDELKLLSFQPQIAGLTIHHLKDVKESIAILEKEKRLNAIVLPEEIPIADLLRLYKAKPEKTQMGIAIPGAQHKQFYMLESYGLAGVPDFVPIFHHLEKQGFNVTEFYLELQKNRRAK
jgi:hypothetical protein